MARTIPKFVASTGYLSMSTDITLAGDFTISFDAWSEEDDAAARMVLGDESSGVDYIAGLGDKLTINIGGSSRSTPNGTFGKGVFYAVQVVRVGSDIEVFIDGVSQLVTSSAASWTFNRIGRYSGGGFGWDGYIKDVFIVDDTTPANSRSWALDEPTAATENSIEGGNPVTYVGIVAGDRELFEEAISPAFWWADSGAVLETSEDQNTGLIFEIGQSNSVGISASQGGVDDVYSTLNGRARQFGLSRQVREGAYNPLNHGFSDDPLTMGHWRTEALGLTGNMLFVPAAVGATGFITNDWNPGDPRYNDAVASMIAALATRIGQAIRAVVWHQGETDGINSNVNYLANINAMRTAMIAAITEMTVNTKWVVVTPADDGSEAGMPAITADLITFAASLPDGDYIDASDLALLDAFHYTTPSQRTIGTRIAAAIEPEVASSGMIKPMIQPMISGMISGMIN